MSLDGLGDVGEWPQRHDDRLATRGRDRAGQQVGGVARLGWGASARRQCEPGQLIGGVAPFRWPLVAGPDRLRPPAGHGHVGMTGERQQGDRVGDRRLAARLAGAGERHRPQVDAGVLGEVQQGGHIR